MRNKIVNFLFISIFFLISCSSEEVISDIKEKEYIHHVSNFSVSGEKLSIFDPASEIDSTKGKKSPKINFLKNQSACMHEKKTMPEFCPFYPGAGYAATIVPS